MYLILPAVMCDNTCEVLPAKDQPTWLASVTQIAALPQSSKQKSTFTVNYFTLLG